MVKGYFAQSVKAVVLQKTDFDFVHDVFRTEVGETLGIDQVSRDFSVSRESQSRETNFLSLSLGLEKSNFSVSVSVSVSSF